MSVSTVILGLTRRSSRTKCVVCLVPKACPRIDKIAVQKYKVLRFICKLILNRWPTVVMYLGNEAGC